MKGWQFLTDQGTHWSLASYAVVLMWIQDIPCKCPLIHGKCLTVRSFLIIVIETFVTLLVYIYEQNLLAMIGMIRFSLIMLLFSLVLSAWVFKILVLTFRKIQNIIAFWIACCTDINKSKIKSRYIIFFVLYVKPVVLTAARIRGEKIWVAVGGVELGGFQIKIR